jgi:hypothetical protein
MANSKPATCELCGEPMPPGEEMFKYHGYSGDCPKPPLPRPKADTVESLLAEREELKTGLLAAIRAAELALFVIRKQGIMPNSSWQAGFERDLTTAKSALGKD